MASHELSYADVQRILALLDGTRSGRAEMTIGDLAVSVDLAPAAEKTPVQAAESVPVLAPAVGVFQPTPGLARGGRVTADAVIGTVDMAGTRIPALAGQGGKIQTLRAEAGTFVEYGALLLELSPEEGVNGERNDLHCRGG